MKIPKEAYLPIVVAGIAGYIFWSGRKLVTETLNPASDKNAINKGVSGAVESLTGGRFLSLGDLFFNLLNSDAPGENGTLDGNGEASGKPFGVG